MKERILDLAKQCGYWSGQTIEMNDVGIHKFAQLIVQECIDIVSPYSIRMENFDGGHPIADLKKHFGVKE